MEKDWKNNLEKNTIVDVLGKLAGKEVVLYLTNGTTMSGRLSPEIDDYSSVSTRTVPILEFGGNPHATAAIDKNLIVGVSHIQFR